MAYKEVGEDAGHFQIQFVNIPGYTKANTVGFKSAGWGWTVERGKYRGTGGGWHKGYNGNGFKIAKDATFSMWKSTYDEIVSTVGTLSDFMDSEFDVIVIEESVQDNPRVITTLKNCRPKDGGVTLTFDDPSEVMVELVCDVIEISETYE